VRKSVVIAMLCNFINFFKYRVPLYVYLFLLLTPIGVALVAQKFVSVERPIISIEAATIALFLVIIYRWRLIFNLAYLTFYIAVASIQAIEPISLRFGLKLTDCYYMLFASIESIPKIAMLGLVSFFFIFLLILYLLNLLRVAKRMIQFGWIFAFFATLIAYDIAMSANQLYPKEMVRFPNVLGAPILNAKFAISKNLLTLWNPQPISYSELKTAINRGESILSVSFESLGIPIDVLAKSRIDKLIIDSFPGYRLKDNFEEQFFDGTLSGELRVLCGIRDYGYLLSDPEYRTSDLANCLPLLARSRDTYSSVVAAHANYGGLYRRIKIYPLIGFSNSFFASELGSESIEKCGSAQFAACDSQITRLLASHLNSREDKKTFTHLMTIDSHFPYSSNIANRSISSDLFEVYISSLSSTSVALRDFIYMLRSPPSFILVSGDHAPPFVTESVRNKFKKKVVPVYILELIPITSSESKK
jgi:hypothetical protein